MTIWGRPSTPPSSTPYFDTSLLREEESKAALLLAWEGTGPKPSQDSDWPGWLEVATDRVLRCSSWLVKEKKRAKGARFRALQQKIRLAKIQLQKDPEDETVKNVLSEAQGHLAVSLQEQIARNHQLSATSWFRYGDTCSKQFFDFHRIGRKRTLLKELTTDESEISGQTDLAHYVRSYYERFYTLEAHSPGTVEAQEECQGSTPTQVSPEMNAKLSRDLSLREVQDAITAMPKDKAPGNNGIPTEFFQELVKEIAPTLFFAFKAMLNTGETSTRINQGIITLIPKSGDHAKLENWRSITLLGSVYKILAKTLARRLLGLLLGVIRPGQTNFIKGRCILDNTFLAQEALDWAVESDQDLVLLLLDFEKAFDRIEWGFLFEALGKLEFCS